jgi:hypothetical protein
MSKEMFIILIGALLVVQTQFGIPVSWHTILTIVLGLLLVLLGFMFRTETLTRGAKASRSLPFKESDFSESHTPVASPLTHDRKEGIGSFN